MLILAPSILRRPKRNRDAVDSGLTEQQSDIQQLLEPIECSDDALLPKIMSVSQFVVFLRAIGTHMGHKCGGREPASQSTPTFKQKDRLLTETSG